jgi:integrase
MPKLTKRVVDSAVPGNTDRYVWDGELSGFGLKVTPAGRKVFIVQYRIGGRGGRTRRVTLGIYGVLTTDKARSDAQAALRLVARGIDPAEGHDARRAVANTGSLIDIFLDQHADAKLKPRSSAEYRRLIAKLVPAALLRKPITEVDRADIARLHNGLRSTPYQANRLLAVLSKFFNWCERHGHRPDHSNPARHVDKFKEDKRKRYLSPKELADLGEALAHAATEGLAGPYGIAAIRLLALTGARLNEILTLRWEEVDFDGQCLRLPDSKTGAKTVYLNAPALAVLGSLPKMDGNPYLICGERKGAHLVNLQKPWRRIRNMAGLAGLRLHDLRHSFASFAVASGMSLPLIGALLGHTQPQTTARYAHLADDPLKAAADQVGTRMSAIARPSAVPTKRA